MYYLMNQDNHIIGADKTLIKHLKMKNLDDFLKNVSLKKISFEIKENEVIVKYKEKEENYIFSETLAYTLLGDIKVIYFEKAVFKDVILEKDEESHVEIDTNDGIIDFKLFAKKMGLSNKDYMSFVNDFVELSKELKETILNPQRDIYLTAVSKITNLSEMLNLGSLSKDLHKLSESTSKKKKEIINRFYSDLNSLLNDGSEEIKITKDDGTQVSPKKPKKEEPKKEEPKKIKLNLDETTEEPVKEEPKKEEPKKESIKLNLDEEPESKKSKKDPIKVDIPKEEKDIDLSKVEPVHFDFQMSNAAEDLGIPVEIIEEFVLEYIDQAEEETVNLIQAYKDGDLKKVQEIGHLLKGAASNLRIEPLAKTLYDIQFCEDINEIEKLTKIYWAKFLSFRNQVKKQG